MDKEKVKQEAERIIKEIDNLFCNSDNNINKKLAKLQIEGIIKALKEVIDVINNGCNDSDWRYVSEIENTTLEKYELILDQIETE